ncbi:hypothetical protein JTE90_006282 [Oedothorax gibbosus]|uniref:VWFA domain-containing protein n=1 Tax=Oedothorax gibbosus TaxID=931172 RepID=A0AAV6TP21_9ARAC|nr:hypothetical protein JTE90_006282 [Oedothorax gibbosus]
MPSMTEDETVKLDKLKGERSQLRRVFTNAARRFSDVLESTDIQTKDISSDFNKVIEKAERLFKVDEEIKAVTFEYTDEEFDIIESYRDKLTEIKSKYSKHLQEDFKHPEDDVRSTSSKVESKPQKSIRDLELKPHRNFANAPVNFNHSSVHVPTNVYDKDPKVLNSIKWSEYLTFIFKNNLAVDPSLNWQYFGSSTGFLRTFPATSWTKEGRQKPDLYDCRTRNWYVKAAASAKDIVILVDSSGSMTGIRKEIARNAVDDILSTLTEDDFVTVLKFDEDVFPVVPCFENSLVQEYIFFIVINSLHQ